MIDHLIPISPRRAHTQEALGKAFRTHHIAAMFLAIFFTVSAGCWLGICLGALFHLRWARRLPALAALTTHEPRAGGGGAVLGGDRGAR